MPTAFTVPAYQENDATDISECFVTIADESKGTFRAHVERRLRYFPDALTADKAAEIIHKSTWHMNTILIFIEENNLGYTTE